MGVFLAKFFINDHQNTGDKVVREKFGKFAGIVGIISNIILCGMKMVIGLISGSIAIIADSVNNLVDASSSIITLIGFKLAAQPEDEEHPYGHARIEYITGLAISMLIIFVGLQLLKSSFDKVLHPDPLEFDITIVIILVIAIAIKIWQSIFNISIGKHIKSVAILATGTDSRNDVIATSAVLVSILIGKAFNLQLDGYMGCLVALFIIWSGIQLIRETSSPLLGEAPDEDLVSAIAEKVKSFDGVIGIHDLVVHNYGPGRSFASMHIEVDSKSDIMESHDMIDRIEHTIMQELKIEFTAHMDPVEVDNPHISELYQVIKSIITPLEGVKGLHDLRIIPGNTHTNVIFDLVLENKCKLKEDEIRSLIQTRIQDINPSYFVAITFDKGYTTL